MGLELLKTEVRLEESTAPQVNGRRKVNRAVGSGNRPAGLAGKW